MEHLNQASIVCYHVFQDFFKAQFVCNSSGGWAAGCSQECLERSGPAMLKMVCLGCFCDIPGIPSDFYATPLNFSFQKQGDAWNLSYFEDVFEPQEGDLIAAPASHPSRKILPEKTVSVLVLPNYDIVTVKYSEGTRCVPFWNESRLPEGVATKQDGSERLVEVPFKEVQSFAQDREIRFLVANFLSEDFDVALLVPAV